MTEPSNRDTRSMPAVPPDGDGHDAAPAAPGAGLQWLAQLRAGIEEPGHYVAYQQDGKAVLVALEQESTRVGRSLGAEIRFDDATVSRRHARIVRAGDDVRLLDDRSLNGVEVNGRRVEESPLADGDVITIGRHTLHYLAAVGSAAATAPTHGLAE